MKRLSLQSTLRAAAGLALLILIFLVLYLKPVTAKPSYSDFVLLESEIESFQESTKAETIDLGLHQGAYVRETLISTQHLNSFSEERYNQKFEPEHYNCNQTSCDPLSIVKEDIFKSYLCGHIKTLPFNFFNEPPYISSNGYSFVFRAHHSDFKEFQSIKWLKVHRQYLSLPEITLSQHIRSALALDKINIDSSLISVISERPKLAVYKDRFYVKEKTGSLKYKSYEFSTLKDYLKNKSLYSLSTAQDETCVLKGRGFCFTKITTKELSYAQTLHTVLVIFLLVTGFSLTTLIVLQNQKRSKQSSLRKLALDNLTHDFRTPVTNMVLMSKDLDQIFQNSPHHNQIKWLSFSSQVHKLHRATEDTQHYIQLLSSNKISKTKIGSLKTWLNSICDESVILNLPHKDFSIEANEYWLNVCIRNLIKNAHDHGGGKISIEVVEKGTSSLEIRITDSGDGLPASLGEAVTEFTKGNTSLGLGLGLSIVSKAAELMGSQLTYSNSPTTFSLTFKKGIAHYAENSYR